MPLTSRQQQFYDHLRAFIDTRGEAPTLEELKSWLEHHDWGDIRSLNSLTQYLDALEDAGKIRRERRKRGIRLLETTETVSIPLLPHPVACGAPTHLIAEEAEGHLTVSRKLVAHPERTYAFRTSGDSMDRVGIDDGDVVLVESTTAINPNDIVLANVDGMGTIKRYKRALDAITLLPESSNPTNQPIYLHAEDDFLIAGRVVQVLKS